MIKVSIVVPVYNAEKYLKKCLDSLINQSLKDIEIIIINDGSTDNSEEVIKNYQDKKIRYIYQANEGVGKTRNKAINIAKGKYIMFVDADDYVSNHFCETMYNKAENEKLDLAICDYFEDRGYISEIRFSDFPSSSLKNDPSLINKINLGPCNKIYSTKMLKENNIYFVENLKYEDAPFVVKAIINAKKIGKVNECLTYYVIHNNSQTTTRDKRIADILSICKIISDEMNKHNYLKDSATNLIVMILCDYTIQQRYINDKKFRNNFIDEAFKQLDELDPNWRQCSYLNRFNFYEKLVKSNKLLTKLYCSLYNYKLVNKQ